MFQVIGEFLRAKISNECTISIYKHLSWMCYYSPSPVIINLQLASTIIGKTVNKYLLQLQNVVSEGEAKLNKIAIRQIHHF